jgi:hypothetical protein
MTLRTGKRSQWQPWCFGLLVLAALLNLPAWGQDPLRANLNPPTSPTPSEDEATGARVEASDPVDSPVPLVRRPAFKVTDSDVDPATASSTANVTVTLSADIVMSPAEPALTPEEETALQEKREALQKKVKGAYKGVFYDNDFTYINDPLYDDHFLGDSLKQMKLGCGVLDIGGEQRVRYHNEDGIRIGGLKGFDDNFWLNRTRLFSNYRITDDLRFYGEYIYGDSGGETYLPRVIEENHSDALNLFLDARLWSAGERSWTLRAGRQELLYGSQRLVSPLDWSNTRRTFDGFKLMHSNEGWNIDGFWTRPVRVNVERWDTPIEQVEFYGVYGTKKEPTLIGSIDLYWLALDDNLFDSRVDCLGTFVRGEEGSMLWEFETGVQVGRNTDGSAHSAGAATAGLGRKYEFLGFENTLFLYYDWASGSDIASGAWNQFFPLVHRYLGFMDLFGRRNINSPNVQTTTKLTDKLTLLTWYYFFFLDTLDQGPFTVLGTEYNPGGTNLNRDLGHELDVLFTYSLSARREMLFGYSFFDAGEYFSTARNANDRPLFAGDAHFLYWQYQVRF